jgi:hypothetical protein
VDQEHLEGEDPEARGEGDGQVGERRRAFRRALARSRRRSLAPRESERRDPGEEREDDADS